MTTTRRSPGGPTILVIEDDEETRRVVVRDLTARGYRVEQAADGATALRRWEARRPDLILLDLGLPDMDGLRIVQHVRREAATPIVILSGRYEEREKVTALDRGADDYWTSLAMRPGSATPRSTSRLASSRSCASC
jgi:two-component system KDP operon response regulator KdpE